MGREEGFFGGGKIVGSIHKENAKIRLGKGAVGAANAFLFDFAGRVPQTGGIDELHGVSEQNHGLFDRVPGRSGVGGGNGAVATRQQVQQGGFPDVGGARNDDSGSFAQDMAFLPGVQQRLDVAGNSLETAG